MRVRAGVLLAGLNLIRLGLGDASDTPQSRQTNHVTNHKYTQLHTHIHTRIHTYLLRAGQVRVGVEHEEALALRHTPQMDRLDLEAFYLFVGGGLMVGGGRGRRWGCVMTCAYVQHMIQTQRGGGGKSVEEIEKDRNAYLEEQEKIQKKEKINNSVTYTIG